METAKIFMTGRSQAVRIPKQYRFDTNEIFINKIGNAIVLIAKEDLAKEYRKVLKYSETKISCKKESLKASHRPGRNYDVHA